MEHYLKPARTAGVKPWWNPRGTFPDHAAPSKKLVEPLVEPLSGARRAGGTLVETSWNPRETLPQTTSDHPAALAEPGETLAEFWWKSGGTLVEPCLKPPHLCRTWWNPGATLVEPGTLEPWWNPGGTLVEPWWNPWWNPGGTLAQGRPEPPRSLSGLRPQSFQLLGKKRADPLIP